MNLVTGGTGLVGSHIILDLLRKDLPVRALKRSKSNLEPIILSIFFIFMVDLSFLLHQLPFY